MRVRIGNSFTMLELAILVVSLLLAACYSAAAGHLTRHMLLHVGLMAVLAPLAASWLQRRHWHLAGADSGSFLWWITVAQLLLFFLWHTPRVMAWMMSSPLHALVSQVSLFVVAAAFWISVFQHTGNATWRAILALLLTGKLFCLVALILVFAPRALFGITGHHAHGMIDLADQQLAGLLMITACPMTYILAAVLLVVRWLQALAEQPLERGA